jgi:NADH-quinone oxidoreductase subunit C
MSSPEHDPKRAASEVGGDPVHTDTSDTSDAELIGVRRGMFGVHGSGDTSGYGRLIRQVTIDEGSPRPYGFYFDEIVDRLAEVLKTDDNVEFADAIEKVVVYRNELTLHVRRELHAVYPLSSITHTRRVRLEVAAPDGDPHIPSLFRIYPTNDWHERETYDFFGIIFDGHPSLTRIEMPDDWQGHPQRKDYPLGGVPVEYKGAQIPPPDQRRSYN